MLANCLTSCPPSGFITTQCTPGNSGTSGVNAACSAAPSLVWATGSGSFSPGLIFAGLGSFDVGDGYSSSTANAFSASSAQGCVSGMVGAQSSYFSAYGTSNVVAYFAFTGGTCYVKAGLAGMHSVASSVTGWVLVPPGERPAGHPEDIAQNGVHAALTSGLENFVMLRLRC